MHRFRPLVLAAAALSVVGLTAAPTLPANAVTHAVAGPRPVSKLAAFTAGRSASLQWTNPKKKTFTRVVARYKRGPIAPATPQRGKAITLAKAKANTATLQHLRKDTIYTVAVWVRHRGHTSARRVATFTTTDKAAAHGAYSGRVTDNAGHPLAHAEISVQNFLAGKTFTAGTGSDGRFLIALPGAAEYLAEIDGSTATGGTSDATGYVGDGDEIAVRAGRTTAGGTYALPPGGAVSGRVTDADGNPLGGVTPYAQPVSNYVDVDESDGFGIFALSFGGQTLSSTANDGTFTLRGLPATAVVVCFDTTGAIHSGGALQTTGYAAACKHTSIAVAARATATVPDEQLASAAGGTLAGKVTTPSGRGVADADVEIEARGSLGDSAFATTNRDGSYEVGGLAAGSYRVCVQLTTPSPTPTGYAPRCRVHDAAVVAGHRATANVALRVAAAVTGRITGPTGRPLAGVQVNVEHRGKGSDDDASGYAVTDSHGLYTVKNLRRTTYRACFDTSSATGVGDPTGALAGCYPGKFRVELGAVRAGIDRQLKVGGALSGRLLDSTGRPAAHVEVDVEGKTFDGEDGSTETNAHGRYTVRNLSAGKYRVCFVQFDEADGQIETCHRPRPAVRIGHTTRHVNTTLPARASIHVSVDDAAGHPISGVNAAVLAPCVDSDDFDCTPQPLFSATKGVDVDASWVTDAQGTVSFGDLGPGRYVVCLFAYYGATTVDSSPTGYTDACTSSTFNLTVAKSQTRSIAIRLSPAGAVTGKITDSAGHPLSGVRVRVTHSAADDYSNGDLDDFDDLEESAGLQGYASPSGPSDGSRTADDGTYLIRGVAAGMQQVCTDATRAKGGSSSGGYLDACASSSVSVTATTTADAGTLALPSAGAIAGRITNRAGHGVRLAQAEVFDSKGTSVASAQPSASGRYAVTRLPAGSYRVCFDSARFGSQCYDNVGWRGNSLPPAAKAVTVVAGQTTSGIDAKLTQVR
jgi:hypothetical protein